VLTRSDLKGSHWEAVAWKLTTIELILLPRESYALTGLWFNGWA